jgi:hypothetical protein
MTRRDDWIDEDEYPDERDVEEFGEDSESDNDPFTIGYVGSQRLSFWTTGRIVMLVIALLIIAALILPLVR